MSVPSKSGVLLINLGTPDAPETAPVRRYLREFLGDPRVLDLNPLLRFLLLEGAILPTRSSKSAAAYRKVWMKEGSPLLVHSAALAAAVSAALGPEVVVELGMRYGSPSIASALQRLRASGVDPIALAPLYPMYAASSTGTALEEVFRAASKLWAVPSFASLPSFYGRADYLDVVASLAKPMLDDFKPDHVLLSYQLPERHVRKTDDTGAHCLASASCCDRIVGANRNCYRAQCYANARGLAERLALTPERHTVSFQSRLGRTPWIQPFTDLVLPELAKRGVKRVAVMCPAFVADCLETLEEIGIRARADFKAAGGEELVLVPSLNAEPAWVELLVRMLRGLM